jgi:NADH:ubiquinone oxidoreductase subunit 6 (subunit J)
MTLDVYQSLWTYLDWLARNLLGAAQPHLWFWALSVVILASGIGVVTCRNLVHAAMLLALCFVGVAGIFVLLNAEFLAAVQVLVYAGGVVTLIIFAIMLSESITGRKIAAHNRQSVTALGVALMMAMVMVAILLYNEQGYYVGPWRWWVTPQRNDFPAITNAQLVGRSLMTTYTLAFWIASVILAIAMIGALILARGESDIPAEGRQPVGRSERVPARENETGETSAGSADPKEEPQ